MESLGTGAAEDCELPVVIGMGQGPLKEQPGLFTFQASL